MTLTESSQKLQKRRSTRISQLPTKKLDTKKPVRQVKPKLSRAPQHHEISDSSSSEDEEEAYQMSSKDEEADEKMDAEEFSEEIGEDFSDSEPGVSMTTRSNSIGSNKENNRRRTRSQVLVKQGANETPSKRLAEEFSKTSLATPSKRKLSKQSQLTPKQQKNTTPRKNIQYSNIRKNVKVFPDSKDSSDESDEEYSHAPSKTLRTPRERLTVKIPKHLVVKQKITPVIISKTPGGTLRTRRRARQNSEEFNEIIDPLDSKSATTLKELASRLHLSKVPEKLPCRENESRDIENFIREVIDKKRGESSAMYISGVPGTGKTATVRAVVNSMKKNNKYPKFVYVEVNAMIFKKTVFVEVYNGIQEEFDISKKTQRSKVSASLARQKLNAIFKEEDSKRPPIVVLIDELDSLCNRKQDVLYDIFEWTALPQSRVTIIGIANTLDFPERMLCQRNASRLDKRRLVFQPYQHGQIQQIVRSRLQGSNLIEPNAVELVAKKIAANTGDLRQALDFLCRAIGIAVEKKSQKLEMSHVLAAQNAVLESLKYRLVKGLRIHQFTMFRAIESLVSTLKTYIFNLVIFQTRENEETIFADIYKNYCIICSEVSGLKPASDNFAYGMLLQLASTSLVVLTKGDHGTMNRRVKLGMTTMEAEKAIKAATEQNKSYYSL
ncbi:hypothetical protein CRE_04614 [Caenorhabditis remanei]|uniref:Origin recognition complex subunit 1 n=1 Tax=Caenorhabditis remanei TaxID=31234 RepID=E3LZF7_CAERE|nr:hypothetical protein CRE_04614 [Caenorhabditis remanei]